MVVKTFRGLLEDGGQDHIRLQTIKGKVGYKIIKFQLMPRDPGFASQEALVQIWKEKQTTVPTGAGSSAVNFSDSDLLAAAWLPQGNISPTATAGRGGIDVIFDNEIVNQDIYITQTDNEGNANPCNYYLELEVIPLTDSDAEFTTLKDIRGRNTTP